MFARGRSSYACRVLLVSLMRASFHNHPTPLQAILLQTASRRLLNCRSWVLVCLILMFVGWADMIMIYCSPYGLRWFYNVSALLCNSCAIAAVRIQVAQLKRLFFRVAFLFLAIRVRLWPLTKNGDNGTCVWVLPIVVIFAEYSALFWQEISSADKCAFNPFW